MKQLQGMEHPPAVIVALRLRRLPRAHRLAHLRALIACEPPCSRRRSGLATLLRRELAAEPCAKGLLR